MRRCYECGNMNDDRATVCDHCGQLIERPVTKGWIRYVGFGLLAAIFAAPALWLLTFFFGSGSYPLTSWALILGILALIVGCCCTGYRLEGITPVPITNTHKFSRITVWPRDGHRVSVAMLLDSV
jgi:hypothetical protein